MSADNGLYVAKLSDAEGYGIFHYFASMARPWKAGDLLTHKTIGNVYPTATEAIVAAHKLQRTEKTEYGVTVQLSILDTVQRECVKTEHLMQTYYVTLRDKVNGNRREIRLPNTSGFAEAEDQAQEYALLTSEEIIRIEVDYHS